MGAAPWLGAAASGRGILNTGMSLSSSVMRTSAISLFDGGFAFGCGAIGDDVCQVGPDAVEGAGFGGGGFVFDGVGEFVVTGLEGFDLAG
jgi:hypothetical protein